MRKFLMVSWMLLMACVVASAAPKKSNVSVLYVGGSSNYDRYTAKDMADNEDDIAARMSAFDSFLRVYFKTVKTVRANEYTPDMSKGFDVTVMDGMPKPLREREYIKDAAGKTTGVKPAQYLPDDFDRPLLTIADIGEAIGRSLGVKNDWYCLCLDADAHHLVKNHPIFNGPWKTKLTFNSKPTPEDAYHYTYFYNEPLEDMTDMWTVQKKGYINNKGYRVGMVARPWGYTDSPDCEYISSGVCAKTIDAVAIGRHGNFFHWGFSASPADMTDEAKVVFANAIVYISKFAGQKPIARKYNERISTREYLKERKHYSSRAAWQERLKSEEEWSKQMLEEQAMAKAKQEKGEKLNEQEKQVLSYKPQPPMTFEAFLKRQQREVYDICGTDEKAYLSYYDENKPYFYGGGSEMYHLEVDEDAKSLGIANNDKRLLDKAIALWENNQDVGKAKRILKRYTLCRFDTPQQWRKWYDRYQDKMFFTESGGWFFMIDSQDPTVPGNDYNVLKNDKPEPALPPLTGQTSHEQPVLVSAAFDASNNDVVIRIRIHPGYHIYGIVSDKDPYIPTKINLDLSNGWQTYGEMQLPSYRQLNSTGTTIYEDEVIFRQKVKGTGSGTVKVTVGWQCCDDQVCLPPAEETFNLKMK